MADDKLPQIVSKQPQIVFFSYVYLFYSIEEEIKKINKISLEKLSIFLSYKYSWEKYQSWT